MSKYTTYEYIWLDGYQPEPSMRSKVKATDASTPPDWSFDGSSTQQAEGGSSDCLLLPVQTYENPHGHDLVMTQVQSADHTTHPTNFRAAAEEVVGTSNIKTDIEPIMAGEDFSEMLTKCPGAFIFLGNGQSASWHNPSYDFNNEALPFGCSWFANLAEQRLPLN